MFKKLKLHLQETTLASHDGRYLRLNSSFYGAKGLLQTLSSVRAQFAAGIIVSSIAANVALQYPTSNLTLLSAGLIASVYGRRLTRKHTSLNSDLIIDKKGEDQESPLKDMIALGCLDHVTSLYSKVSLFILPSTFLVNATLLKCNLLESALLTLSISSMLVPNILWSKHAARKLENGDWTVCDPPWKMKIGTKQEGQQPV